MVNRYDFDWRNASERSCMNVATNGEYVKYRDYAALEAERDRLAAIVRQIVMEDDGRYVMTELGVRRIEAAETAASEIRSHD